MTRTNKSKAPANRRPLAAIQRIAGAPHQRPMRNRIHLSLLALAAVVSLQSNSLQAAESVPKTDGTPAEVGRSVEDRPIHCRVFGTGKDTLMIIATIHGNEAAGTPLVAKFADWLEANPDQLAGKRVVIVPVANPDGFAANVRFNANEVDLNRNYPAGNWGEQDTKPHGETPLSEPESRVLMRLVCRYFPQRVISIHQPVHCIDYDGPAQGLAEAMAAKCKLPVKKLGSRPGSLGSFVGLSLGKPIITLELPKDAGMDGEKLWAEYGESLVAALRYAK